PTLSTPGRANASDGAPRPRRSTSTYTCCKQAVVGRPLDSPLAAALGVDDAAGDVAAHLHGVLPRLDGQSGLHPRADRVPDDLVPVHVLDRAHVELALIGPVLRYVGQPELVRAGGGELVPGTAVLVGDGAEVVVDGWAGLLALALLLPEHAP